MFAGRPRCAPSCSNHASGPNGAANVPKALYWNVVAIRAHDARRPIADERRGAAAGSPSRLRSNRHRVPAQRLSRDDGFSMWRTNSTPHRMRRRPQSTTNVECDARIPIVLAQTMPLDRPAAEPPDARARVEVRGACPHDCPDTCATVVTVEHGRAIAIRGADDHPPTGGTLCTKVARYLERTYSPDRVLFPMKRVGPKGRGAFTRIDWDEAIATIAARFADIAASPEGPEAILPYSYCGTMGLVQSSSMDRRFFHRLGASLLDRTICATAGKAGWVSVIGAAIGMDVEAYVDSRLILIWGSNPIASNLHFWTRAQEAKRRGARLVAIDPYRSATAEKCHQHIAVMPGTDAALALGLMHVLIDENLVDHDYIARHTLGFDALAARIADWHPARVARVCRIDAGTVRELARAYGTTRPAAIRVNYGMQRHAGGG